MFNMGSWFQALSCLYLNGDNVEPCFGLDTSGSVLEKNDYIYDEISYSNTIINYEFLVRQTYNLGN